MKIIAKEEFAVRCLKRQAMTPQERQGRDRDLFLAVQDANPFNHAANLGKITTLLENGASPNTRDPETGRSPMTAVVTKEFAVLLLAGHGSLTARDKNGQIGLVAAIDRGHLDIAQTFLQAMLPRPVDRFEAGDRVSAIKETLRDNLYTEALTAGGRALQKGFYELYNWVREYIGGQAEHPRSTGSKLFDRSPQQNGEPEEAKARPKYTKRPMGAGRNFFRHRKLASPHT